MIKRSLHDICPILTSHACGEKRVLIANDETCSSITQIAITKLSCETIVEEHAHNTMEEYFFVRDGAISIRVDGDDYLLEKDDFISVEAKSKHAIKAITDCELLTIGVAVER